MVKIGDIENLPEILRPPPITEMHINMCGHSSTSTMMNIFSADGSIRADHIDAVVVRFVRETKILYEKVLLLRDFAGDDWWSQEESLLDNLKSLITDFDPAVFIQSSDVVDSITYIYERCVVHGESSTNYRGDTVVIPFNLNLSAFPGSVMRSSTFEGMYLGVTHEGRYRLDLVPILKKFMVSPPLDGYTLQDAWAHPKMLKNRDATTLSLLTANSTLEEKVTVLQEELHLLAALVNDNAFLALHLELGKQTSLSITNAIERGQQRRIAGYFMRYYNATKIFINSEMLKTNYAVIRKNQSQTSFPDPPWLVNPPLATLHDKKSDEPPKKKNAKKRGAGNMIQSMFPGATRAAPKVAKKNKTTTAFKGGLVLTPFDKFYNNPNEPVVTLDFGSLYPSIIEAYVICYMQLLYNETLMHEDGIVCETVPITEEECCVFVRSFNNGVKARSITDVIIAEVTNARKKVRKAMKSVTCPFTLSSMDATQLSLKVVQNSAYGRKHFYIFYSYFHMSHISIYIYMSISMYIYSFICMHRFPIGKHESALCYCPWSFGVCPGTLDEQGLEIFTDVEI